MGLVKVIHEEYKYRLARSHLSSRNVITQSIITKTLFTTQPHYLDTDQLSFQPWKSFNLLPASAIINLPSMKFSGVFALALFAASAGAEVLYTSTTVLDNLHGWCRCVSIPQGVRDDDQTQRACGQFGKSLGAQYDESNGRCWTTGSRIGGKEFQNLCYNLIPDGPDNALCS